MKKSIWSKILDYVPAFIAFGASLIAVIGNPKWDQQAEGLSKVTTSGWAVIVIGVAALVSSVIVIRRNHRGQAEKRAMRMRIATIGKTQLINGVERVTCVL